MERANFDRRSALFGGLGVLGGLTLLSSRANGAVKLLASAPQAKTTSLRTLVLLQMTGGNDGLSTVVPFAEDAYQKARPTLALTKKSVLPLDDYRGLHPSLVELKKVWDAGKLAIIEGAGYPNPIRSHFKSYEVWHTADIRGRAAGDGWIGRLCDASWSSIVDPNLVVHVGTNVPYSLHSSTHPPIQFVNPASYRWAGAKDDTDAFAELGDAEREKAKRSSLDFVRNVAADSQASSEKVRAARARYKTPIEYPDDALGLALNDVAALVNGELGSRVLSVELAGFDTHTNQKNRHDQQMKMLDGALGALLRDLERSEAGKNAVVMLFSEFGRRIHENGARGTDHGVAAPMFVAGAAVKGGLHGKAPSFSDLDAGDLKHTTDFRSVYATVIERWFAGDSSKVLRAKYPLLGFLA